MYAYSIPQKQENKKINYWTDLFFNHGKRAGYIAITDFKQTYFYGANDVKSMINATKGKEKQFISINAFDVDFKHLDFSRETDRLKQIRNIAIDIDQYKLGLSINDALDALQSMILSKVIPEPNLVLTSRGIQLFYTIHDGASPDMAWKSRYITEQYISKLEAIGADSNAKDLSRVMRVPNSINERNMAIVMPSIWNDEAYTLNELESYCKPLDKFKTTNLKKRDRLAKNIKLDLFYKTNHARLDDLDKLLELRKGDLTGCRNIFLFMYSFHQALIENSQKKVIWKMRVLFKDVYSKDDRKPLSKSEFDNTVKKACRYAEKFFNHFIENNYNIRYSLNDGIIKPYSTKNVIKKLNISVEEQHEMRTLRNKEVAREQKSAYMRNKRRSEGVLTREEYERQRKEKKEDKLQQLQDLMKGNPFLKKSDIAKKLGISRNHLYRLLDQL